MKIATILGARPQFIKAATLSRAIAQRPDQKVQEILIHTGQHYDDNMSAIFFQEMDLPHPHYHLEIGSGQHGAMTGRMLEAVEKILCKEQPDWVLVYGDTNSTLAGALAAAKMHIPIAHVEAGLRSFNRKMPEEINRILTDHCATLLFTPTESAAQQLHKEGIPPEKIAQVGDVMYDASLHYKQKAYATSKILNRHGLPSKGYALVTVHRAENTDSFERLKGIVEGLNSLSHAIPVIWPLHPRTKAAVQKFGLCDAFSRHIKIIEPVGYFDMISLETNAQLILTDSGGVQKEAYFYQVPCLTLREETEWAELLKFGFNRLVDTSSKSIIEAFEESRQAQINWDCHLYGKGDAAQKILDAILQYNVKKSCN